MSTTPRDRALQVGFCDIALCDIALYLCLAVGLCLATVCLAMEIGAQETPVEPDAEASIDPAGTFDESITVRARPLGQIARRSRDAENESVPLIEVSAPDRLGRFPDHDAAGAAQRLPGLTVVRDQGDARLVLVRGFLPSFNSATLDGERIPAGEADERAVALDLVPTELLEAVKVTKTPTPDMDGDAVGGTVELVTRRPPEEHHLAASLGAGHEDGSDGRRAAASATLGTYLAPRRLGVNLSTSHRDEDRGVDSVEILRDDSEAGKIEETRFQDHEVRRERSGVAGAAEWTPRPHTELRLRGLWSEFEDLERRRARVLRRPEAADDDEGDDEDGGDEGSRQEDAGWIEARELKDRPESQELASLALDGSHLAGDWRLGWRASWARGREEDPDRLDTIFTAGSATGDGDGFVLEGFRTEEDRSENEDRVVAVDLEHEATAERRWQLGVKRRDKDLRRDENLRIFTLSDGADDVPLAAVADGAWRPADPFSLGDLGPSGLFPDPAAARGLFAELLAAGRLEVETDREEDLGDFTAGEDTTAAYGLVELALGDATTLVAGARWEHTETDYLGVEIHLGDEAETIPLRGGGSYDELLPSAVLRHAVGERHLFRAGVSRTLARPDLEALAPSRLVIIEDEEIVVGNPDLVPVTSWNVDLQWRRLLEPLGSLSLALYAKELSNVIVETRRPASSEPGAFTLVEPRNAGDATVVGLELSFQNRFRELPPPFDGLGLLANLTWADADADLFDRPTQPLPGQAEMAGSLVLSYETKRVSARLLYSYRDEIIEELGESPALDVYLEERGQLDLSLQVQWTRRWAVFAEAFNLTREPQRLFEGTPDRPIFEEEAGWWATVGLRFDL